nr:hypothetical protein [Lysobacter enzymogenes]
MSAVEGIALPRGDGPGLRLERAPALQPAPRPQQPPRVDGQVRIAAFNLENLFNGDGRGGGFPTPRGARTEAEFHAQLAKLVETIHAMNPDVAALMELENDGYGPDSTLAQLVAALDRADAASGGAQDWRYAAPCKQPCALAVRGPGDNAIRVGLIYRGQRVAAAWPRRWNRARSARTRECRWRRRSRRSAPAARAARRSWSRPTTSSPRAAATPKAPTATRATARPAGTRCAAIRRGAWTRG